jgi:UDP-GlcNAc3NAcA epimerase
MKIVTIVGARPQFIKAAVVSRAIEQHNLNRSTKIQEIIIHTGQHYDRNMSEVFFEQMQIPHPRYNLGISGISHGVMTGQMLEQIEAVLLTEKPDLVLVYGDTNSTLAGALAAVKLHISIAHVEAGLRSFNMKMPEEINRIITDRVSHWLFCPSSKSVANLSNEGLTQNQGIKIHNVGDVMYDAALFYQKIAHPSSLVKSLINKLDSKFYLATVHRAENTDDFDRLTAIMNALDFISKQIPVILPLHPRTKKKLADRSFANIQILEPLSYFDMLQLLTYCHGVLTDSGGLQKEAYFFAKHCITFRDETEWGELVDFGFNYLVGADFNKIVTHADWLYSQSFNFKGTRNNLYGQGNAGELIVKLIMDIL